MDIYGGQSVKQIEKLLVVVGFKIERGKIKIEAMIIIYFISNNYIETKVEKRKRRRIRRKV